MRRALIAGIHANLVALEAVLKDIEQEGVDEIGCLGGILTFGPDVVECSDLIRERCAWSLCGHHDLQVTDRNTGDLNSGIQKTIARCRTLLEPASRDKPEKIMRWNWLRTLDSKRSDAGALFVYGSVRDPVHEFLMEEDFAWFGDEQGIKGREAFGFEDSVCFCANTGRPGVVEQGGEWIRSANLENSQKQLNPEVKTIVNIGNVGQPRDRDPRSCYVIWDDLQHTVTFHRVPYDLEAAKQRFETVAEIPMLHWQRLVEGT